MKKKEKMVILVLLIITIALIAVGVVTRNNKNTQTANNNPNKSNSSQNAGGEIQNLDEENVVTLDDGTRLNTSKELKKEKTIDGMKITEIQLTEKANMTVLLANLTNTSNETKGGYVADITLLDKEGNELTTLHPYIDELAAGESTQLNASTSLDFANAYNFRIEKQ